MADGSRVTGETSVVAASGNSPFLGFFFATRVRALVTLAVIAAVALAGVAGWRLYSTPELPSTTEIAWFIAASTTLWLPLLLLLLDSSDNMAQGPRLALPLTTVALLAGLAAFVALDAEQSNPVLKSTDAPAAIAAIFALLSTAFLPRVWNAVQFAIHRQRDIRLRAEEVARKRASEDPSTRANADAIVNRQRENDEAEALGATIATAVVIGICGVAWWAGDMGGAGLGPALGVGITLGVIALFAVVIFLDWISDSAPVRGAGRMLRAASRHMAWLAAFYNAIDAVLVRIGAHASGMDHHSMATRYLVLGGTLLSLCVLAWFLPTPFGLIPAGVGFILALSVSRLWSWVEEDRNLAAITRFNPDAPRRVGFREDFRDETLLGFIFVLLMIPIAMMQADASRIFAPQLFEGEKSTIWPWFGYFGFELAKALPVVDWADIYRFEPDTDLLRPVKGVGDHAVFAARAMVDLVLVASLLQAIGIATRNRQQKALFAAGHIDRLDELVEKEELNRAISRPRADWFRQPMRVDFRRYDPNRLKEIHSSITRLRLRTFIGEIFLQSGRTLDPAIIVLDRIARTTRDEGEMHRTFDAVRREHETGVHLAPVGDLLDVLESLRGTSGLKSLKVEIMNFAAKYGSPVEVAEMMMAVMTGGLRDAFQYTRIEAARILRDIAPRLPDAQTVADMTTQVEASLTAAFGAAKAVPLSLLEALRKRLEDLLPRSPRLKDTSEAANGDTPPEGGSDDAKRGDEDDH